MADALHGFAPRLVVLLVAVLSRAGDALLYALAVVVVALRLRACVDGTADRGRNKPVDGLDGCCGFSHLNAVADFARLNALKVGIAVVVIEQVEVQVADDELVAVVRRRPFNDGGVCGTYSILPLHGVFLALVVEVLIRRGVDARQRDEVIEIDVELSERQYRPCERVPVDAALPGIDV